MINFSKIPVESYLGKILRNILKIIPRNTAVKILQGKLKGKKWIKGSGVNSYWLGTYELGKQDLFTKAINKGDTVFDIGTHVGFYSLLAAEAVGSGGKVFSFEPLPQNFDYLEKHIKINNYQNIFPFKAAVADKNRPMPFKLGSDSSTGSIADNGDINVDTVSIDELIKNGKLPMPDVIKIDVEGSELMVLGGMLKLLKDKKPAIFLSTHGSEIHNKCYALLFLFGYSLSTITDFANELLIARF
jgi:FkbM family methyltransferase